LDAGNLIVRESRSSVRLYPIRCEKRGFIWPVALAILCLVAIPYRLLGDDRRNSDGPPKTSTTVDAPAPVTERERILLDRLEELEKRVAELEAKGQPAMPSSSDAPASQPSEVVHATVQPAGGSRTAGD